MALGNSLFWQTRIDNRQLQKDSVKTQSIFKQLSGSISKANLFAGVGVAAGLAIREVIKVSTQFEKSISSLSSITGAVGDDLDFYKDKAIEFGESTTQSATQVADAFKLIGSQKPELLQSSEALAEVTREAITLAEAAEVDVPIAARALTNSLNQTSSGAERAGEFINILAAASKLGAGDIPYLSAALEKSAKVAKDSNLTYAETVSVIEQLAPAFAEPSSAGLHFKAVLLRLQKQGFGFESGMFDLQDALNEVRGELDNIVDPAERSGREIDILGARSITAGKIMIETRDSFKDFAGAIEGTNVAYEQAQINTDNVKGSLTKLQSAIEGVILKLSESGGLNDTLKGSIELGTEFVSTFSTLLNIIDALKPSTEKGAEGIGKYKDALKTLISPLRAMIKYNTALVNGLKDILSYLGLIDSDEEKRAEKYTQKIKQLSSEFSKLSIDKQKELTAQFKGLNDEFKRDGDALKYITALNKLISSARNLGDVVIPIEECPKGYHKDANGNCVKNTSGSGDSDEIKAAWDAELKIQQEFYLSEYLLLTNQSNRIEAFKIQQRIEYLEAEKLLNTELEELEIKRIDNSIILLERQRNSLIENNEQIITSADLVADANKRMFEQGQLLASGIDIIGQSIEKTFADGEGSLKEFGNAMREVTADVIGALVSQAVASVIAKSFTTLPPPVALAIAPLFAAAAKGLFKSLVPKFAEGGVVGGSGNRDNQMIMATPGEVVLNSGQQANLLMKIANSSQMGGTESLLKEQNNLLRNSKSVILKDNIMYVVQGGQMTGEKVVL